ncbi:ATP-binding protein [bacterium]|nr:ATP-binding protein [bacterium]
MRYLADELGRILDKERKMAFVAGPRQVGKTTLAKFLLKAVGSDGYFNWDIETHRRAIIKNPVDFWSSSAPTRIVLDEIHKYPRWKRFLKGLYDEAAESVQMIVTGSGRLDIYQRGGDSLLGRYGLYRLHPFTVAELLAKNRRSILPPDRCLNLILSDPPPPGAKEALESIETFTGFPEPLFASSVSRLRRWRGARRQLVLKEDLRDLTRIRELGLIETLVAMLPERVGSPLSLNSLREDLGVAFGTVRDWVRALGRLYYIFEIRPYAGNLARALRREAKVYLFDGSDIEGTGARFENLVALHLHKACDAWTDLGFGECALHYVRDKEKREADFLVVKDKKPWLLIETKQSSSSPAPALKYFRERLKAPHAYQLVRDAPPAFLAKRHGVTVVSAARFLARLP